MLEYLTAFAGGLLSFLSPCVLPLVPPYLAFMAGTTLDQLTDDEKVNEALKAEVASATDRFFTPELRTAVAAWMKDAAIGVRSRSGDDDAQHVLRVAKAVEEAGLITSPPNEIPFLQTFFQKAIAYVVSQNQGQLRVPVPGAPAQV